MGPLNLHQAILKADFILARRLIEAGANVNSRDEERRTPLMLCCLHDGESWSLGVARMLLIHRGQVGLCDRHGRTALVYAVLYGRLGLVRLFLQALDYDLNHVDKHGHMALWYSAQVGNGPINDLLLKTMRKYCLSTDISEAAVPRLCGHDKPGQVLVKHQKAVKQNAINCAIDHKVTGHLKPQPEKGLHPLFRKDLPYKPLPETLWTKRENFYKTVKPPEAKPETKKALTGGSEQGKEGKTTTPSPSKDWKLDMRSLTEVLLGQISLSYRPQAQPRPPSSLLHRRRTPRLGASPTVGALLRQRWGKGRKMSLDAISDSLLKERTAIGSFRRRCSVTVIPMIRMGLTSRSSSTTELEGRGGDKGHF